MTKRPLCKATLKDGSPCRSVIVKDCFCAYHAKQQETQEPPTQEPSETQQPSEKKPLQPPPAPQQAEPPSPESKPKRRVNDIRSALRADAAEQYDRIAGFFDDALDAEREVRGKCSTCGATVSLSTPDWSARTNALKLMLEAGYGKPPSDEKRVEQITEVDGVSWPDFRTMSTRQLEAVKLTLLLQHPDLVKATADEVEHVRSLVAEHGDEAVPRLVKRQAERDADALRKLAGAVASFAPCHNLATGASPAPSPSA